MKQRESDKNIMKKQEAYIQEMEQYISALEAENDLHKQMIEMLQEQNAALQRHYEEYADAVHRMMDDFQS